jgi:hypothetical protein
VLKYLARYTHRVAISNQRLLNVDNGQVTFRYKDYAADQRQRTLTLTAEEFLRRFVQHVLPKSFVKVRHYGLLANRQRRQRLHQCRRLLFVATAAALLPSSGSSGLMEPAPGPRCPHCGSSRIVRTAVPPPRPAAAGGCSTPSNTS